MKSHVDCKQYGFMEADLDREFYIDAPELSSVSGKKKNRKLKDLMQAYKNADCKKKEKKRNVRIKCF